MIKIETGKRTKPGNRFRNGVLLWRAENGLVTNERLRVHLEELLIGGIDESANAMSSFSVITIREGSSDNDDSRSLGGVPA
jgi:hypothetical protein